MSDLRQRIADLPPEKRALLERQLLDRMRGAGESGGRIPRRAPAQTHPLSHTQRRLWFLAQWAPQSPAYNIPGAFRLRGTLDADALHDSLDALVMRHESLRTTFRVVDGAPMQTVAATAALPRTLLDLSGLPPAEREGELARGLKAESRRPFDLSRDPMLRTTLWRLGPTEHVLLIVMHHIASDGFSLAVFRRELCALYSARVAGAAPALPELPCQYADFACSQLLPPQEQAIERSLAGWKSQLAGAPLELELPADHSRPPERTDGGARVCFRLPIVLARSLAALSRAHSATLFMTLLAAFDVLLHRYTGLDDLLVGTPIANRARAELEGLIGFFANTLALRADLSGNLTFLELLARVRKNALDAYSNADAPFDRLVEALRPERTAGRTPVVQVVFAFQNAPSAPFRLQGLDAQQMEINTGTAKFDLTLDVNETPDGFSAWFEYSTDLFERETIERMVGHFRTLLEGIAADPARRLSELPLLTQEERQRAVVEWNRTAAEFPGDRCVHELFERQAALAPKAVAVLEGKAQWTYAELEARATRLARRLRRLGVKPGARVCVLAERSARAVAAFLAILKAGAAYVPLDPSSPKERLAFIAADAGASIALVSPELMERMPAWKPASKTGGQGTMFVPLEEEIEAAGVEEDSGLPAAGPDDLAYVIYTSGSTGAPKGVAVPHRAIARLVMNTDYARLDAGSVVAHAANIAFDAATFEIWGALLNGGELVIVPKETLLAPNEMDGLVARDGVNVLFLTTALFNEYAREKPALFGRLRIALFGGEAADPRSVAEVLRLSPPGRLIHTYGPTEATTFAAWSLVVRVAEDARSVPIGRPIANTTAYILDRSLNVVPVGVPGELHIGGPGVALGYLNRPELTAERFIRDPFDPNPGARLYKTGDLARYLPGGDMDYIGRMDRQVKIRGFRIELGEIEAALCRHPAVKEAVVILREEAAGGKSLAAYVTALRDGRLPEELRQFLRETLPEHMVPATLTVLEALPLTANGKLDRRALPAPARPESASGSERAEPEDAVERELARVWQELFGVPAVGVHDNFFDLGGHSLLAVRLFARIEETFGTKLPVAAIFEAPTVKELARRILEEWLGRGVSSLVAVQRSGGRIPLFCVAPKDPFEYAQLARRLGPDQPFYIFHPAELMDAEIRDLSVESLAARYVGEMQSVQPKGPYLLGGLCAGGMVAYEMAQQLRAHGHDVGLLALMDAPFPGGGRRLVRQPRYLASRMGHHLAAFWKLSSRQRIEYVKERWITLTRRRGAPAGGAAKNPLKGILQAYQYILPQYAPKPYNGYTVLFLAAEGRRRLFGDGRRKWCRLAVGRLELHVVPGRHHLMLSEPHVGAVAELLRDCLHRVQQREGAQARISPAEPGTPNDQVRV